MLPAARKGVVAGEAVGLRGEAEQDFQRFGRLHGADYADQRGEHAGEGAAAVATFGFAEQAGVAGAAGQIVAEYGYLSGKAHGGAGYQGDAFGTGGGVDGTAGGEVVAAVEHGAASGQQRPQLRFVEPPVGFDAHVGVVSAQPVGQRGGFQAAYVGFGVGGLALQVAPFHSVVVGNNQAADTGGGQIGQCGGAQSAAADNEYGGIEQALLAFDIDLVEQDVAAVAEQLAVVHGVRIRVWGSLKAGGGVSGCLASFCVGSL